MEEKLIKNHSIYKYADDIKQICNELFAVTSINYFCFGRVYKNGDYSGLLSDKKWAKVYLENDYQDMATEHHIILQTSGTFFWNLTTFKPVNNKVLGIYRNLATFKHASGVFLIEDHPEYKEAAIITTDHKADSNDPYLIENVSLLKNFILYFKEKIYQNKQLCAAYNARYQREMPQRNLIEKPNSIKIKFPIKKYYFDNQFNDISFSKREAECIKYLYYGKTSKEIAKTLGLSPRTVETYFEKIKQKTQASSIRDVCKKLESCTLLEGVF